MIICWEILRKIRWWLTEIWCCMKGQFKFSFRNSQPDLHTWKKKKFPNSNTILRYLSEKFCVPSFWYPSVGILTLEEIKRKCLIDQYLDWSESTLRPLFQSLFWNKNIKNMNETRSELLNDQIQFEKNMQVIEQPLFRYGMIKKKNRPCDELVFLTFWQLENFAFANYEIYVNLPLVFPASRRFAIASQF